MLAKFYFPNVRAFITSRVEVRLGETFRILLQDDDQADLPKGENEWFSSKDPVLKMLESEDTNSATITATEVGKSIIQIQDIAAEGRTVTVKTRLEIVVFPTDEATQINVVVGEPRLKRTEP